MLCFLLVSFIMAAVGFIGISEMRKINANSTSMSEDNLIHLREVDELKENFLQIHLGLISLLTTKDEIIKTVMLTGDAKAVGEKVANFLELDEVHVEFLPYQKVEELEKLDKEKSAKEKLAFVGDGINDAPVLARADIGIAMGGLGSDAGIATIWKAVFADVGVSMLAIINAMRVMKVKNI